MSQLPTPNPPVTADSLPFWEGATDDRLVLPRCNGCAEVIWYPRHFCPRCGSADVSWFEASGQGSIYSFTVVERGQGRWAEHSPYVLAYVELAEGPRVLTNIIDTDPDSLSIGDVVHASFDHSEDGRGVLRFTVR
ncbi:MAG: Zn-ribbon domain-containing OB-fold protein [Actinomycetota bacterium]|nr:Zn-ribbon domain-containing OB-fold protein [Actinomycetota bacterium]